MRFLKDGPSIPDELLIARDESRVVFFCGAGVSRAGAGLPDFFGLAEKVIEELGVPIDHSARKLIKEAKEIDARVGTTGVISADRVFGLLERNFKSSDIERAVARALKPKGKPDLSAHQTLVDLATSPAGAIRLVTTNFDRLFDKCAKKAEIWRQPKLPDPGRSAEVDGIVYLHGRATAKYDGAEGEGFILSSSEFGRAYLSDGWATSFIRDIIEKFYVVFVGYAADDPPVQYLLEALNRTAGQLDGVYAFQSGTQSDAIAKWRHKGVQAISYDTSDNTHDALWKTLAAWAERAKDIDGWYDQLLKRASGGPEQLSPHERGQVAHTVSTLEGARRFCRYSDIMPADWLCVFDPIRRYAQPGKVGGPFEDGPEVDPFDLYGLDSDVVPKPVDPDDHFKKREMPSGAWDAFALNRLDRQNLRDESLPAIRGHWAGNVPRLPARLSQMGSWIESIVDQIAAVWWAAYQMFLHPDIKAAILWEVEKADREIAPEIRRAWLLVLEAEQRESVNTRRDWYALKAFLQKDGWSAAAARRFEDLSRPSLKVGPRYWSGPRPPAQSDVSKILSMLGIEVGYVELNEEIEIPADWLVTVVRGARRNLELAAQLEHEVGGLKFNYVAPIIPDEDPNIDRYSRRHGLSSMVIRYASYFEILIGQDAPAARAEFSTWPSDDDTVFARLRMWAAGKSEIVSTAEFAEVILALSDEAFWNERHQRDLLLTLAKRWPELAVPQRGKIESKLLGGPPRWDREDADEYRDRQAWSVLNRLGWLSEKGCGFSFDLDAKIQQLRLQSPKWKTEYAQKAAESHESRGGTVRTNTEHASLLDVPVREILAKARQIGGRTEDFLEEKDPFQGLCVASPIKAFRALVIETTNGELPVRGWETFLRLEQRKSDKPRFMRQIALRLSSLPSHNLSELVRSASNWLQKVAGSLSVHDVACFDAVIDALVPIFQDDPNAGRSGVVRGNDEPDWVMEAINSPVGSVAQALFDDPRKNNLQPGGGFPENWLQHASRLVELPGDQGRYALVIFCHNLSWFYLIDPEWTEAALLTAVESGDHENQTAALSGFFWGSRMPPDELYARLKPTLVRQVDLPPSGRRSSTESLAGILLAGWGRVSEKSGNQLVSDDEMRQIILDANDEFRVQLLWHAEQWAQSKGSKTRWSKLMLDLLTKVWPKQLSAKSPAVSARLVDLAFDNVDQFPKLSKAVLPLISKVQRDQINLPYPREESDKVIGKYPGLALQLLHAVLPDDVASWPYGIEGILRGIGEADEKIRTNVQYLEIMRRWNAR